MDNVERYDYLKYYRTVRRYAMTKYSMTNDEFDFLFLVYGEKYFYQDIVNAYDHTTKWHTSYIRSLIEKGFIIIFKMEVPFKSKRIYKLSHRGNFICRSVYGMLEGTYQMSTKKQSNPMLKANARYRDRKFRALIMKMNEQLYKKKLGENVELDLMPNMI